MDCKMKKEILDLTIILLIILLCVIGVILILNIKNEGAKCIKNPLVYGLQQYSEDLICTCSARGFNPITFTKDGLVNWSNFPLD